MTPTPPPRVLLVDLGPSMGGVEAYLLGLAQLLQPENEVFVLCVLEELAAAFRQAGVRVFLVNSFPRFRPLRYLAAVCMLVYVLVRYRIRVMQINGFLEGALLLPARLLGCRAVYTRHGPLETDLYRWYRQPLRFLPRFVSQHAVRLATQVVCVSHAVGSVYKPLLPAARLTVIPNWIHALPLSTAPNTRKQPPFRVLYVGRIEQYKGVQLLIEAIRNLDRAHLTVVGVGSYLDTLRQQAAGLNVEFAGFQRDTGAYYKSADVFVMPSLGPEGLPMVSLEAMAHTVPCILSDLPVHGEITDQGQGALLFRTGEVADLQEKLTLLMDDDARRAALARNGRRIVEERYHAGAARQAYLSVFARAS